MTKADSTVAAPLAVTMGDPAGVGGEVLLQAWSRAVAERLPTFAVIDDADRLEALAQTLGLNVPVAKIDDFSEAPVLFPRALPVLHRPLPVWPKPGRPDARAASRVIGAIDEAIELYLSGAAGGIVTNPIHKETLYRAGFTAPGHTEYLAERIAAARGEPEAHSVMMLACPALKVIPVTVHLALSDALSALTQEMIVRAGLITARALQTDFGLSTPRLAVAALNPHAGEGGMLGREEIDIIAPACERLRAEGVTVSGPLPADTLFHEAARPRSDAVLCMYHDQALIPLKTIDFARGVNVTLGLPVVRTSPDHGTAFDIAGKGIASAESLIESIRLAGDIARRRRHAT